MKGNHEELKELTKVANLFKEIVIDKAVIVKQGKLTGNSIQQYVDASPRVEDSKSPRVPDRLSVVCLQAVVTSHDGPAHPMPPLPNYITQEQP